MNRIISMNKNNSIIKGYYYICNQLRVNKELETFLKKPLIENEFYLQKGNYYFVQSDSGKVIAYKKTKENKVFLNKLIDRNYKMDTISNLVKTGLRITIDKLINYRKINISHNGSRFKGQLIMVTYNKDVKIFDLEINKVLNIVTEKNAFTQLKQTHQIFNNSFKTLTLSYLEEDQGYVERYIDYKPYKLWSRFDKDKAVEVLFSYYKNYFLNNIQIQKRTSKEILKSIQSEIKHMSIINKLKNLLIFRNQEERWPIVKCHGDIVFSNILLYEKEYFVIDWIDSGEYIFYYDLLNFMFGEAAFHNNYLYIENFFKGKYDKEFSDIFKLFGHSYRKNQRLEYLALFVVERINFRINNKNDENLTSVLDNYYRTLIKIEQILEENQRITNLNG